MTICTIGLMWGGLVAQHWQGDIDTLESYFGEQISAA